MLHDDELAVDEDVVRRLLVAQAPQLAALPVRRLAASGSSNWLFRLGEELLVRLPRQPGGSASILREQRWTPSVAPHLTVPCPEVVLVGAPGRDHPESWSVVRWLPGERPRVPTSGADLASDLADLVAALRVAPVPVPARADPALHSYRAEPLHGCDGDLRSFVEQCRALEVDLDLDALLALWRRAAAVRRPNGAPRWVHADLLAENLLVCDGRLAAVLDLGGLAVGDPAVDLVVAWEVLDGPARSVFRERLGVDDDTWLVGAGWALLITAMTLPCYAATMPERCRDRLVMARAVLTELG